MPPTDSVDGTRGYFFGKDGQPAFEVDVWPLQGEWGIRIREVGSGPIAIEPGGADVHKEPTEGEAKRWAQGYLQENRASLLSPSYQPLWEPLHYNLDGTPALL